MAIPADLPCHLEDLVQVLHSTLHLICLTTTAIIRVFFNDDRVY
jgi:hypothetical protein